MDQSQSFKSFWFLCFYSATISLGWFNIGYLYTVFDASGQQIILSLGWRSDDINIFQELNSGSLPMGSLIAVGVSGLCFPRKSRRKQLMLADFCTIIGSVLTLISPFQCFLIGRLLQGVSIGINMLICPIYIREISPPEISGRLGSLTRLYYCLGVLTSFVFAMGLPKSPQNGNKFWIIIFFLPALVSSFRIFLFYKKFVSDSPKYYMLNNKGEKCSEIIAQIYHAHTHDNIIKGLLCESYNESKLRIGSMNRKFSKQLRVCFLVVFLLAWTGNNSINYYSANILVGKTYSYQVTDDVRAINCLISFTQVICAIVGGYLLDFVGRSKLLLWGDGIIAVSVGIQGLALQFGLQILPKPMVVIYVIAGSFSFILVNSVMLAEMLPVMGCCFMYIWSNLQLGLITFFFPKVVQNYAGGLEYSLYLFSIVAFLGYIALILTLKETKNLRMDEVYNIYQVEDDDEKISDDGNPSIDVYFEYIEVINHQSRPVLN